jgi:hypothetical protein
MKNTFSFAVVLLLLSVTILACGLSAPTNTTPQVEAGASTEPGMGTAISTPTFTATSLVTLTAIPISIPTPTDARLKLEIVQSLAWTDRDGNVRVNVLVRNPYDFPILPEWGVLANLLNNAGKILRTENLYFLDGISGGAGFFLPGETISADACFTCEKAPLTEAWASVEFDSSVINFTPSWTYSTAVEATVSNVSFSGDSPIFDVTGTVKNKSNKVLSYIYARIIVFDQKGDLVGAAEGSASNVAPGASASFIGSGIGKPPSGPVKYTVTALGVNY